jgi:hypothetical protein
MRKLIVVAIILAMCVMVCPQLVGAATYVQIGITATGSDITISCNETDWSVGTVGVNEEVWTTDNMWATLTNSTTEAVDVSIHGHDMSNGGTTWTMSDNGSNAVATFGMKINLSDNVTSTNIPRTPSAAWLDEMVTGTQQFGLYFIAPSLTLGNLLMTMANGGLYLEATID